MKLIGLAKSFLSVVEKSFLVLLLSVLIVLAFTQVILRQFFSTGLLWADVFLRHSVIWIGFFGAAIAASEEKHFAIDLLKKVLPPKAVHFAEVLTDGFAAAVSGLLFIAALSFWKDEKASGSILFSIGAFEAPSFWMDFILPAGFALLAIHFALQALENLLSLGRASGEPE